MVRFALTTLVRDGGHETDFVFQAKAVNELHTAERHFNSIPGI